MFLDLLLRNIPAVKLEDVTDKYLKGLLGVMHDFTQYYDNSTGGDRLR